ncbi:hypothetical protein [Streptomyces benahoarensis]|uniref:Uncharacterized protein n=1 Tax=Streptomyces benahoarensis TaxID=2595054 RepID=A0A553ZLI1_9ACTN|nr:hypothetical protein [Streptomyces benahoarensis]TSB17683.1 hypothetical protein FNJ62_26805 [Streptomyces benahoarensis]TSB42146.1 hypothetical protein FNZ23_11360 [Streptomyces benahoarensis]
MKTYLGRHEAVTYLDLIELALGTPLDLWLGEEGESAEERAARLDAARDIAADDPGLYDRALRAAAQALDEHPHLTTLPSAASRTAAVTPLAPRRTAAYGAKEVAA